MQRVKILGLAFMAVLALSAVVSASASAAKPEFLPEGTEANPITFSNKGGAGTLETKGGSKVSCTSTESSGSITSLKLGKFDVLFLGCTTAGKKCTGLNDKTAGSILVLGTVHLWYGLLKTTKEDLHIALVFLLEHVHFSCGFLAENIDVLGCVAALVKEANKLVKSLEVKFESALNAKKEVEKGINDITKVLNEKNEEIPCTLKTKVEAGAEEQSSEITSEKAENFKQGGKAVEVLIMS